MSLLPRHGRWMVSPAPPPVRGEPAAAARERKARAGSARRAHCAASLGEDSVLNDYTSLLSEGFCPWRGSVCALGRPSHFGRVGAPGRSIVFRRGRSGRGGATAFGITPPRTSLTAPQELQRQDERRGESSQQTHSGAGPAGRRAMDVPGRRSRPRYSKEVGSGGGG